MALNPGTKLGPYEVQGPLGAGGMGEVYRARDLRLERTVAIKILPSHLSDSSDAKQRFDREARTISSLNHPNICTLYDVGHQDGVDYLVMEYMEGETLAERLRRGPMPLPQLLKCAIEICEGLDRAHRSGVIHRDLKPGNVMLTKTGAKLMDFGLAKAAASSASAVSNLTVTMTAPAQTHPLTAQGTVVGTFQYMAPEQVEGRDADTRSDIFALGAVLYEMATAKRAFEGKTPASAMAAILEREPAPISTLQPTTPVALDRLVKTCLAKDPDERWQTAHDVKLQLKQLVEGGSQSGVTAAVGAPPKKRPYLAWGLTALFALAAVGALATAYLARQQSVPVLRTQIIAPDQLQFNVVGDNAGPAAISPDGRYVVYSVKKAGSPAILYLRALDSLAARALPGTEDSIFPFWSPDSRSIAFFTPEKLKRIDIDATAPVTICDSQLGRGGTWGADGTILAALSYNTGIWRVPASGGTAVPVTTIDSTKYSSHRWPWLLPDGKHFLYLAVNHTYPTSPETAIFVSTVDGKENRLLMHNFSNAIFASGFLLYQREGGLVAQKFDPGAAKFTGEPQTLGENAQFDNSLWRENVSVSQNGIMVYATAASAGLETLDWYDRTGKHIRSVGDQSSYQEVELSPDEKKLALTDNNTAAATIWVLDLATNLRNRLTFTGGVTRSPVWSPDSTKIAFSSEQQSNVVVRAVGGGSPEQVLLRQPDRTISAIDAWTRDGKYLLFQQGTGLSLHLNLIPLEGEHKPIPYSNTSQFEWQGTFSPDGRWVAYVSTDVSRPEIFVAPFPWTGEKWQISTAGGVEPRWRGDGKELYFYNFSQIIAVDVNGEGKSFKVGKSTVLFPFTLRGLGREWDVSRDGKRFLAITQNGSTVQPLTLVQNWAARLAQ